MGKSEPALCQSSGTGGQFGGERSVSSKKLTDRGSLRRGFRYIRTVGLHRTACVQNTGLASCTICMTRESKLEKNTTPQIQRPSWSFQYLVAGARQWANAYHDMDVFASGIR